MEKVKQKFSARSLKLNCWSPRHTTDVLKLEYLSNALSFSQPVEISNKFTQIERKLRKFTGRLNSKNFCSMYFMQKLPTTKANFIFKNMQDFNQTTHVWPQDPSVFTDNISFYFYPIISIKKLMKQSRNGTSQLFQYGPKIFQVLRLNMHFRMQNVCFSTRSFSTLDCTTVSKWQKVVTYETFWIREICKYFF